MALDLVAIVAGLTFIIFLLYRSFLHPLSSIPGPLICRYTNVWMWYHTWAGDDCTLMRKLHGKYGPVVRIGPNECVIADGAALAPIYSEKGGFLKAECYSNFDLEGHKTIFSAQDPAHRAIRSKAVTSLFSTTNIRGKHETFEHCAKRFVDRLREEAQSGKPVNILNICRKTALEMVCSILFDTPYGSIDETADELSAAGFVDSAVAYGRLLYMPPWLFALIEGTRAKYFPSTTEQVSGKTVNDYGERLVENMTEKPNTYPSKLSQAGVSQHEVEVQCKDVMFAGTDSSGTVLSTTCWHLAKNPGVYSKLKGEVKKADAGGEYSLQSLKYLDAVIREGLRMAKANPNRFPRVVPPQGWTFTTAEKTYHFPAGTVVGLAPLTLHYNEAVFADAELFDPDRWLDPSPEMQRDLIPFNLGPRQCIARNMAQYELLVTLRELARSSLLDGAKALGDEIRVLEWFNSRIIGGKVELVW